MDETLSHISKQSLPLNLNESIINFEDNKLMKSIMTDDIHKHYYSFFNFEYTEYMNQVDEWELNRYFYNI